MFDYKEIHIKDYTIRIKFLNSINRSYTIFAPNGDIKTYGNRDKFLLMLKKEYKDIWSNGLENVIASY